MTKHKRMRHRRTQAIRFTPEAYRLYTETIARHEPETFAILGGYLDDPFLITDFVFAPPRRLPGGGFDASRAHVNLDHDFINWVVDNQWKPNGKYMLGIHHSHPTGTTRPSTGDPATNEGDIVFFTNCLDHDDSPDANWRYFLAPITTFAPDGSDLVHGWVLKRGEAEARPCHVVIDPFASSELPPPLRPRLHAAFAPLVLGATAHLDAETVDDGLDAAPADTTNHTQRPSLFWDKRQRGSLP